MGYTTIMKLVSYFGEIQFIVNYQFFNPLDFMSNDKKDLDYSIPPITTKIKYSDINKKQSEESFTIVTHLSTMSLAGYSGEFTLHKT